ncbi:hypothetical protein C1646_759305 [Rhizophagus diaphanus]|nr:hypothetical protein C1646_759305 [Rhizophagus diaphanus] [Rhizophagus sp. MUCL 43196]
MTINTFESLIAELFDDINEADERISEIDDYLALFREMLSSTSVSSERLFSDAGLHLNVLRSSLDPDIRCINGDTISNKHARRKDILQSIDKNDKLASISCDYDTRTILYEAYVQAKATIAENTMPSAPKFEPACITNAGQKMTGTTGAPNKLRVTFDVKSARQPVDIIKLFIKVIFNIPIIFLLGRKPDYREAREWRKERKSKGTGKPSNPKKRKKDQDEEEENEGIDHKDDDSATISDKLIEGIKTAREDKMACLTNPLCWGVVDLRAENVSPCPNHPRAKEFLSDTDEKRARGIEGICSLLGINSSNVKIYDKDTQYIGECMDAFNGWVHIYGGTTHRKNSRHAPYCGENHSDADRDEKSSRSRSGQTGSRVILSSGNGDEIGIGENTGPTHKDHYKKSVTDFVDVIKVARSQHISFQTKWIEECGLIGMKIRFYILIQINGDLYGMWEWSSQDLPRKDDDIITAVFLCKKFLIHRNLLNRTARISQTAIRNSQIFRENVENTKVVRHVKKSIKLSHITTPKAKRDSSKK